MQVAGRTQQGVYTGKADDSMRLKGQHCVVIPGGAVKRAHTAIWRLSPPPLAYRLMCGATTAKRGRLLMLKTASTPHGLLGAWRHGSTCLHEPFPDLRRHIAQCSGSVIHEHLREAEKQER